MQFSDCWDVERFEGMFSNDQSASKHERESVKGDTHIGGWNRRCLALCMWCPVKVDPGETLAVLLLRLIEDQNYVRRIFA